MALVSVSRDGHVATITLNRPDQRNALSIDLCEEIVAALGEVDTPETRVVVLRGAGKVFCSGADFAAVSGAGGIEFLPAFERMLESVAGHRLPTVAAVHGAALGGGLQLATACDFRVVASDAKLGIPSARLGIVVNFENVRRLVLLAGLDVARGVLMAGRTYTGAEAEAAGLATQVVERSSVEAATGAFAARIAALAPLSVQGAKRALAEVAEHLGNARRGDPARVAELDRLVAEAYGSDDLQEGLSALAESRSPSFRGR